MIATEIGKAGRWLLLAAAGRGVRSGLSRNKAFEPVAGVCPAIRCLAAFSGFVEGAVVVIGDRDMPLWESVAPVARSLLPVSVVVGGDTRTQSIARGLVAIPQNARLIAVHDAARPFVTPEVISRCFNTAAECGAVVPAVMVSDTIIRLSGDSCDALRRDELRAVQTPQVFEAALLREAYRRAEEEGIDATDDAALVRAIGHTVAVTEGDAANIKLTLPNDFALAGRMRTPDEAHTFTGFGMDAHRLAPDRRLVLCGVTVPHTLGLLGHSDADAAVHALIDALLGAARMGDIGRWFPDTDPSYKDIRSILLLERTVGELYRAGFMPVYADITIAAQRPKLAPYVLEMADNVARALGVSSEFVNVKATTTERMGYVGREEGIAAYAIAAIGKL